MYLPQTQYTRLPTNPEPDDEPCPSRRTHFVEWLHPHLQPIPILRLTLILSAVAFALWKTIATVLYRPFGSYQGPRPPWLEVKPAQPLRLRVAIISRPNEFDVRMALRESVLWDVPKSDVEMEFWFFVGRHSREDGPKIVRKLKSENDWYGDVVMLDIDDIPERVSEKRFAALKWVSYRAYSQRVKVLTSSVRQERRPGKATTGL